MEPTAITVAATVAAPAAKVWACWTSPEHITQWNNASPGWHCPAAVNDLRPGGKFSYRMEAKDGSFGFDFWGVYDEVVTNELITYTMGDGRKTRIVFSAAGNETAVTETFEAESENSAELQKTGWQAILDNFKKHAGYVSVYEPLRFSIVIEAPKIKVWDVMLDAETYKQWAGAAWPGSYYEGEWKEGGTVYFFNPEKSGTKVKLLEHREYEFSLAEHISSFNNGVEDTESKTAKGWIGSKESYTFTEAGGKTTVEAVMYVTAAWHGIFMADMPKALAKLKEICETDS
jgi:uncharacterized protein YndB with AHSA1/START domain